MDRFRDPVEVGDPYEETTGLMHQSLITVEQNCHSLRDHVKEQRTLIADSLSGCSSDPTKTEAFKAAINFYDHVRSELVNLEEICQGYRVRMKAEAATETLQRLQPLVRTSSAAVNRAHDLCDHKFVLKRARNERKLSMPVERSRNWTNAPRASLEHAQNIIYGPRRSMPSEFDESDEKFKQEIMILRTQMFSLNRHMTDDAARSKSIGDEERVSVGTATKREFIETVRKSDSYVPPLPSVELTKIENLKFIDGEFVNSDLWTRILDMYGQQLRSRWYLAVCPRIETILRLHRISTIHLSPTRVFDFLMKIPENGHGCVLSRKDLVPLLAERKAAEIRSLLETRTQFRGIHGKDEAAKMVQSYWRGFWVRKCLYESECKYIAASVIWVAWIVTKKKRQMHERYLRNMLTSLDLTRRLSTKLSVHYRSIVMDEHVILNLPSAGYPQDIRRTFQSKDFAFYQNTMGLRWSLAKNPRARVIHLLPFAGDPAKDLSEMYREAMGSISPSGNGLCDRVTFLELSQAATFAARSFNLSRILHASEDTLLAIRRILENKPAAFCLPWITDECDVRVAGNLSLPLLAPDVETQRDLLDKSRVSSILEELGVEQPACVRDVHDYRTLCDQLAERICANAEICLWLFKLNNGAPMLHDGVFLINHISVPFMPILRKEREIHGERWNASSKTRANLLKSLREHLPRIVATVTRFSGCFRGWNDFWSLVTKYGCFVQAVPNERTARHVSVTLFLPGNESGESTRWTGTAELIQSARKSRFFTVGYTVPQSCIDNAELEPTIARLSDALRRDGYFGHLCVDLCCFRRKRDDKIVNLVVGIKPCYEYVQHYVDWIELACDGAYDRISNKLYAEVASLPDPRSRRSSTSVSSPENSSKLLNETKERYAIVVPDIYHSGMSFHSWKEIGVLSKECGIKWNNSAKEGSHLFLHETTSKKSATLITITTGMAAAMTLTKNCLKKLSETLDGENIDGRDISSNLLEVADYIDDALEKEGVRLSEETESKNCNRATL